MKLYPRSEVEKASSLKFYLEKCNLKSKIDMPISTMNKIYENRNAVEMRRVANIVLKTP